MKGMAISNPLAEHLIQQWHPFRNGDLTPAQVTAGSNRKVWWVCDRGHEWQAYIFNRSQGCGCAACSGRKTLPGFNDLATTNPTLASQWHPTKNDDLTPAQVTAGSNRKVWWVCDRGHEWEATVASRFRGCGCAACSGRKTLPGFNDLATTNPTLASQWHPTKNGELTPQEVSARSQRKIWWVCDRGHEWQAYIFNRSQGCGCAACSGRKTLPGFNDLATTNPALAAEWHPTKNDDLTPAQVTAGSNRKVWWVCDRGHEWEATVASRCKGTGCPACSNRKVLAGFNDLGTTHPELARQWHPTRNAGLAATQVTAGSRRKAWWVCDRGHEWQAYIFNRSQGCGCAACSGRKTLPGFNDLATTNPTLASQWHPTKNDDLTPAQVTAGSNRKVWWVCNQGHEWEAAVGSRSQGTGCPACHRQSRKPKTAQSPTR